MPAVVQPSINLRPAARKLHIFKIALVSPSYRMHCLVNFRYSKTNTLQNTGGNYYGRRFSLILSMLGLGAAGAVSAGQNAKIKKADYQYGEEHGLHGTSEVLQMRERVRKEWWSICGKTYNACERPASSYGDLSRTPWCYLKKRWFIDHLNKKGIPYDDLVVDDVTGVTFYESQKRTSQAYMRKLR